MACAVPQAERKSASSGNPRAKRLTDEPTSRSDRYSRASDERVRFTKLLGCRQAIIVSLHDVKREHIETVTGSEPAQRCER